MCVVTSTLLPIRYDLLWFLYYYEVVLHAVSDILRAIPFCIFESATLPVSQWAPYHHWCHYYKDTHTCCRRTLIHAGSHYESVQTVIKIEICKQKLEITRFPCEMCTCMISSLQTHELLIARNLLTIPSICHGYA